MSHFSLLRRITRTSVLLVAGSILFVGGRTGPDEVALTVASVDVEDGINVVNIVTSGPTGVWYYPAAYVRFHPDHLKACFVSPIDSNDFDQAAFCAFVNKWKKYAPNGFDPADVAATCSGFVEPPPWSAASVVDQLNGLLTTYNLPGGAVMSSQDEGVEFGVEIGVDPALLAGFLLGCYLPINGYPVQNAAKTYAAMITLPSSAPPYTNASVWSDIPANWAGAATWPAAPQFYRDFWRDLLAQRANYLEGSEPASTYEMVNHDKFSTEAWMQQVVDNTSVEGFEGLIADLVDNATNVGALNNSFPFELVVQSIGVLDPLVGSAAHPYGNYTAGELTVNTVLPSIPTNTASGPPIIKIGNPVYIPITLRSPIVVKSILNGRHIRPNAQAGGFLHIPMAGVAAGGFQVTFHNSFRSWTLNGTTGLPGGIQVPLPSGFHTGDTLVIDTVASRLGSTSGAGQDWSTLIVE